MNTQQTIKHAVYISRATGKDFRWGTNDCMTFLFGWYDYVFGTNHLPSIREKYFDVRTAVKFWHNYPMSVNQWMYLRGFTEVQDDSLLEGDLRIEDRSAFPSAYIYHNGAWWTVSEGDETRAYTNEAVLNTTTHWRHA
jgi:hypothetical protein